MKIKHFCFLEDSLRIVTEALKASCVALPFLEGLMLHEFALGMDKNKILSLSKKFVLSQHVVVSLNDCLQRRLAGEPMAYVIGHKAFWNATFCTKPGVLIPRPETEGLIEYFETQFLPKFDSDCLYVLDMCSGTGCIALSVADVVRKAGGMDYCYILGVDVSKVALNVAKKNEMEFAKTLFEMSQFENKMKLSINWLHSNYFENLSENMSFDIIFSNPPYIPSGELHGLEQSVIDFEPVLALDGGEDGLDAYRILANQAGNFLSEKGEIVLELGFDQMDSVKNIFIKKNFIVHVCNSDLSGVPRVLVLKKGNGD